jgi:hypothetical protein
MSSQAIRVLDTFIADGSVATYTSVAHMEALAGGRNATFSITATDYDDDTYLWVFLETSVDGRNFQSKYIDYYTDDEGKHPTPVPLAYQKLRYTVGGVIVYPITDTAMASEPPADYAYPTLPNHRHARLRLLLTNGANDAGKSGRVLVDATVRGSQTPDDAAPAPAPAAGSLARHEMMMGEMRTLGRQARALPQHQRAAFFMNSLSSSSKEHMHAVERRLRTIPPHVRKAMIASTADMTRRAIDWAGGPNGAKASCDDCQSAAPAAKDPTSCGGCGS